LFYFYLYRIYTQNIPNTGGGPSFSAQDLTKFDKKLKDTVGKESNDFAIRGKKIFKNATPQEMKRASKSLANNNPKVFKLAMQLSDELGLSSVHDVLDMVEITNSKCLELSKSSKSAFIVLSI